MAIFLGSSNFNGSQGSNFYISVYLDKYTQNIESNATDYTLHLYMSTRNKFSGYGVAIPGYLQGVQTGSTTSVGSNATVDMGTYSGTLQHNADGTGWLGVTGYVNANAWYGVGEATVSTGWTAPTIPRQATISGNSSATIEETYSININRLVSNYNYTLRYSITDDDNTAHTGTIATGINVDKYAWTVPEVFYQYWTIGDIKRLNIYCDTYNGNNLIGTTELNIQLIAPSKTKPNIIEYTFKDENATTVALTGDNAIMVKGYSNARFNVVAELGYYAKTSDVVLIDDGTQVDYTIQKNSTEQKQVIAFDKTFTNFNILHSFRIKDTRGMLSLVGARTNTMAPFTPSYKQILYETVDYIPLTLNMSVKRPNSTTGEVELTFSGNYFNNTFGNVDNTLELSWKYREKGVEAWTVGGTFTKDTDYEITGNLFKSKGVISLGKIFNYQKIYEIAVYYKDKLVDTYTTKLVTRGLPIFWWNKDGVYDSNNKKFLVDGEASKAVNEYSESTTDTYSCDYINKFVKETVLFENPSGTTGNITLKFSATNYDELRISGNSNSDAFFTVHVPTNKDVFVISVVDNNGAGTNAWLKQTRYSLDGAKITNTSALWKNINGNDSGTDNTLFINKIVGLKRN